MSSKQRKTFELLFITIILSFYLFLTLSNINAILNWFLTDDAFYYFKVAQNVSEGAGFSFDGINLGNGFQPLWMFICIPVFALARFDLFLPFRVLLVIIGLFHAGSFILLYRLLRRFISEEIAVITAVLWGFSPFIINTVFNGGLESGLNAFFILLFWERLTHFNLKDKISEENLKQIFWLGVIGLLTILSRLDNVFLVFFGSVWLWIRWWNPPNGQTSSLRNKWLWRIKTGTAFNGIIVFGMSLYLAWNKITFGDFMPVSGKVKIMWGSMWDTIYGKRVINISQLLDELLSANFKVGPWALLISKIHLSIAWFRGVVGISGGEEISNNVILGAVGFLGALTIILFWLNRKKSVNILIKIGLIPLFLGTVLQAAYYKKFGSVAHKAWYWIQEYIFIYIAVAIFAYLTYSLIKKMLWGQKIVLVLVVFYSIWLPFKTFQQFKAMVEHGARSETHEYNRYTELLNENFEPGTVIGMTGSGAWGYFAESQTIINLDGLINSIEYYQGLKDGTAADLLSDNGMQYVIGKKVIITESMPYYRVFENHLEEIDLKFFTGSSQLNVWKFIP
ncbi:MAG: hypothetical protein HON98_09005 [Chloroflexi bacterium]|jgi:hypothetical protein|nr:hypothetical protein [Chloroflexota bacterium]MBT3670047.1 hypothetical protein [Chloroflexota bacterium]MBT4003534.1 hypothetical protein [Chloroflexota bacterium]MBT4306751.1 hypothetical protein [Chloroflexota bacterium]MBT4532933.1 hypothetical protein [Chloroflexota bacterium]